METDTGCWGARSRASQRGRARPRCVLAQEPAVSGLAPQPLPQQTGAGCRVSAPPVAAEVPRVPSCGAAGASPQCLPPLCTAQPASCSPIKCCGLGNGMQKPLLAVCNPPSFSTSLPPPPRASHRAACCKRTEKMARLGNVECNFEAIAQSGVVW